MPSFIHSSQAPPQHPGQPPHINGRHQPHVRRPLQRAPEVKHAQAAPQAARNLHLTVHLQAVLFSVAATLSTAELMATTGRISMADPQRPQLRWQGHAARMTNDVMVKQLLLHTPSRATLGTRPHGAPAAHVDGHRHA